MKFYMNLLLSNDADEYILFLINSVPMQQFNEFIECIDKKKNWYEELCCCYFEKNNEMYEYYRFETFEGDTYKLAYDEFLKYVKLAIVRFYLGSKDEKNKDSIREAIKNTIFKSSLDNIDASLMIDVPLIG